MSKVLVTGSNDKRSEIPPDKLLGALVAQRNALLQHHTLQVFDTVKPSRGRLASIGS